MKVDIENQVCDGHRLKWLVAAGLAWLEQNHEKVDQLNVFPVPDGDTGKNMMLTLRSAYREVSGMDESEVGIVGDAIAHGALMGARGNSGVILSQLWQGFAESIRGLDSFDAPVFAQACQSAVKLAYRSVTTPVEGTILTVAREATEAVVRHSELYQEQNLQKLLTVMVDAAQVSLKGTPDLLPVLKKAGVVDSGGQGLVYMLQGMLRLMNGEAVLRPNGKVPVTDTHEWQEALEPEDAEGYGYDVQFLMHGQALDVDAIRTDIDAMGWSTLVVGNERLVKVHVHVHDPGQPLSYAIGLGASIDDVVVENMQDQYQHYVEDRLARQFEDGAERKLNEVGVIVVASGDGLNTLFAQDLQAAYMISGGQTMNPSTQDFLAAIDSLPHNKIVLLPNNKNIVMAAQQAASLARDKDVRVVPSRTLPQGISAMVAYTNVAHSDNIEEVITAMLDSLRDVTSAEVTMATRDVEINGVSVRAGQYIGLLDGDLVVSGDDLYDVLQDVLSQAVDEDSELITLYYGSELDTDSAQALVDRLATRFQDQSVELVRGDQPLYPFIISVE
ncbi:MAG: DAK2 domain-containing protein [Anaerolineae bacterium]|nr:DAK2 domain-containing protein [Anaerolineae bacterium]